MTRHFLAATILAGLFSLDVPAQQVVGQEAGTVSVNAVDVPVGVLLRELRRFGTFSKFRVDPSADAARVTISLDRVPVHVAVIEVLKQTDVGFVLAGGVAGEPFRLIAEKFEFVESPGRPGPVRPQPKETTDHGDVEEPSEVVADLVRETTANTERALTAMTTAVTGPQVPPHIAGVVTLPFPDTTGAPIIQSVAPGSPSRALPFPAPATAPNQAPSVAAPSPPDPALQALEEALAPPGRAKP